MSLIKNTIQQLTDCGKVGMYRFGEVIRLTPEQAEQIVRQNEILYINKSEMHQYGVNRMIFKRDEIRSEKTALPYCGRFEFFEGKEFITIQEVYHDTIKCKLIGPKEDIELIKSGKMLHSDMTKEEFEQANADVLNEIAWVKGYYNKPEDETDINGFHISKIEDYDNYSYSIYDSEKTVYRIYNEEAQERFKIRSKERTVEYLKNKIDIYQKDIDGYPMSRIKRTIRNKPEFVEKVSKYDYKETDFLIKDMIGIASEYKVGLKRAWKVWKFLMVEKIQKDIEELEDELGEYSINNIWINTEVINRESISFGEVKMNWLTGVIQ